MKKIFILFLLFVSVAFSQDRLKVFNNTTTSSVDSINIGFTPTRIIIYNDATSTDTLYMSSSNSFPADVTIKRIGGTYCDLNLRWQIFYVKVGFGVVASKKYRVEAIQ